MTIIKKHIRKLLTEHYQFNKNMAGYKDTRQLIIDTLMNRPAGTEIQPEDHQEFALAITDYVRSVELLAGNAFIGFAEANTAPIQSDKGQCFYISTVGPGQTVNFVNFIDSNGNAISVSSPDGKMSLVTLIWNTQYWSSQIVTIDTNWSIAQQSGSSESMVMSQKAVGDAIAVEETRAKEAEENLDNKVTDLEARVIYDVSAHNNNAVFESLQALLSSSNLSTLIPPSVRHGGMSIKFIQGSVPSSDNKYVQYRLTNQNWSVDVVDWQNVDTISNVNLEYSYLDYDNTNMNIAKNNGVLAGYCKNQYQIPITGTINSYKNIMLKTKANIPLNSNIFLEFWLNKNDLASLAETTLNGLKFGYGTSGSNTLSLVIPFSSFVLGYKLTGSVGVQVDYEYKD